MIEFGCLGCAVGSWLNDAGNGSGRDECGRYDGAPSPDTEPFELVTHKDIV